VAWGYGPRRAVLDKILLDAALAAGVDLLEATSVDSLLTDGSRVVGIRTTHDKRIRARLTIGADGKHSRVAREVGAQEFEAVPTLTCWYFSYFQDVPDPCFEMHLLPQRRVVFAHPTNDGLMAVFVGAPIEEFGCIRADPEAAFLRAIDMAPGLGARLRDGFRAERLYGTGDIPNFLRKPFGPGWALVGDAACHKDPFLAMGICDALRDAELLAEAAHAGLSGALRMENALAEYRACRDKQTLPDYQENVHMARLGPIPADVLLLRQALKNKPAEATRFVLASHGRIPREEFFNPEHLDQLLGA
jgi:flavin-dependent dehydrogenase